MCTFVSILYPITSRVPETVIRLGNKKLSRFYHHHKRCYWGALLASKSLKLFLTINESGSSPTFQIPRMSVSTDDTIASINALSKKQARELAVKLSTQDRDVLIAALQECQSQEIKAGFEGQLAAFRWRSKFGRPSRVSSLGDVDPTGSYCTIPDDWLLRKYAETVPLPTRRDLIRVSVANAIPFIGFGFLDNFFMIIAGEQIETSVGAIISLSTMAAAAFGNTISDILGIGSTTYVERLAQKIGFQPPKLTPTQLNLPKSRNAANLGRVIGVTIGCLLGMTPLLILHQSGKDKESKDVQESTSEKK